MAKYAICEGCKKLIEYKPETKHEYGFTYTTLICPLCGYTKKNSVNHVHYGQDGRK